MNPISASQMGIAPVPPCRDVQWVGPVPAGGIAPDTEHSRATRTFGISSCPAGFYHKKGCSLQFGRGCATGAFRLICRRSAACDWEQIACARFRVSLRRFGRDHGFGLGRHERAPIRGLRGPRVTASPGHPVETLWEDGEFVLSRGVWDGEPFPLLAVRPSSAQPSPETWRGCNAPMRCERRSILPGRPGP